MIHFKSRLPSPCLLFSLSVPVSLCSQHLYSDTPTFLLTNVLSLLLFPYLLQTHQGQELLLLSSADTYVGFVLHKCLLSCFHFQGIDKSLRVGLQQSARLLNVT
ncbi:hypothetical protein XENOCAPTIV_016980 [Xenoophorus captivus]|uniref:Secreted protein n=1 Tax=Xenoophorus captivus TaxID=1517983 RepID=A0ABV0R0Z9_9TELE